MWRMGTKAVSVGSELFQAVENWQGKGVSLLTGNYAVQNNGIVVDNGGAGVFPLAHLWIAHLAIGAAEKRIQNVRITFRNVYVVDCAIRFNVFAVSDECMRRHVSPESVLSTIKVRRDFTPYQLLATTKEIIQNPEYPYVYFFLSPCKQFFDSDVGEEEARFLLRQLLSDMNEMNRKSIPVVLVEKPGYRHPVFHEIFPEICSLSFPVWRVDSYEHGKVLDVRVIAEHSAEQVYSRYLSIENKMEVLKVN